MNDTLRSVVRYGLVGVSNTAIGMGVIYVAWKWLGLGDLVSNAIGYLIGILWSYMMNRYWTFRENRPAAGSFVRFALVCAVAYAVNLAVLFGGRGLGMTSFLPHLLGNVAYTCVGFVGSRYFAFRAAPVPA